MDSIYMVNHIRQVQSVNLSQKSRDEKIHQKNFLITKKVYFEKF